MGKWTIGRTDLLQKYIRSHLVDPNFSERSKDGKFPIIDRNKWENIIIFDRNVVKSNELFFSGVCFSRKTSKCSIFFGSNVTLSSSSEWIFLKNTKNKQYFIFDYFWQKKIRVLDGIIETILEHWVGKATNFDSIQTESLNKENLLRVSE